MTGFWDQPELARPSDFISFKNPGDTVTGVIKALRLQTFVTMENGVQKTKISPQLDIETSDGLRTLTAGQMQLQAELLEKQPNVGDMVTITMTGVQKRPGGKTLKEFTVTVGQPAAPSEYTPQTEPLGLL